MAEFMSLAGEKVYLNPIRESDLSVLTAMMNDDHIKMFGRIDGSAVYESRMKERLAGCGTDQSYAIFRKDNDRIIGDIDITSMFTYNRSGMLGISIYGDENRGRGFGKEAILLMLKHAFIDLNLESLHLGTWEYNAPAIRLYEKLGFRLIGRRRHFKIIGNRLYDEIMMDMISSEYFELYGNDELKKYGL